MTDNPLMRTMTTVLDQSVRAASWLQGADQYAAGVALARTLAGQLDDVIQGGQVTDPEVLKQLHMRMIPNYQRALFTLGLTPEGYAKMTGVGSPAGPNGKTPDTEVPTGVASPFAAASAAEGDPLEQLITAETERTNVIDMEGRR